MAKVEKTLAAALGKKRNQKQLLLKKSPLNVRRYLHKHRLYSYKNSSILQLTLKISRQIILKNNFMLLPFVKNTLTALLRQKTMIMSLQLQIFIPVPPVFSTDHTVEVQLPDGKTIIYTVEKVFN